MYSENFPHLIEYFNFDNFEVIAEALEKNFSDLFQLGVLDELAKQRNIRGSYWEFFNRCMTELIGLYTLDEVNATLSSLIVPRGLIHQLITQQHIFVPTLERVPSHQIAWREKLETGTLTSQDPLSYIDLVRAVNRMQRSATKHLFSVCHLRNLSHHLVHLKSNVNNVVLVNVTDNPKKMPKWCVVNFSKMPVDVFCEALLTEDEKLGIEKELNSRPVSYLGGTADFSFSTGLTALAWINDEIERSGCALTRHSDYYAMVEEFTFIQQYLSYLGQEETSFVMEEAKNTGYYEDSYNFARAAILGDHNPLAPGYGPNDLVGAIRYYHQMTQLGNYSKSYDRVKDSQTHRNGRSFSLALDAAMADTPLPGASQDTILTDLDEHTICLTIPEDLNAIWPTLQEKYSRHCQPYAVGWGFITKNFRENQFDAPTLSSQAGAMVLTVFRARAKKSILNIQLPKRYSLSEADQRTIFRFMGNNAYVTELLNPLGNSSLEQVRQHLLPIFARNRWLKANGYLPPMSDDYWKQAARYWILHLHSNPDILLPKQENELFKRCVEEMGIKGLQQTLSFLNDETEQESLKTLYGMQKPAFFAACPTTEYDSYFTLLLEHLQRRCYFPYSELGLPYQHGNDRMLSRLLSELNRLDSFEKITLTNCLDHKAEFGVFLRSLIRQAQSERWTSIIAIPELEDKERVRDDERELRQVYALLNDIILINRQRVPSQKILKTIKEASDFSVPEEEALVADEEHPLFAEEEGEGELQEVDFALQRLDSLGPWPLKRGGTVQLQLQQQQQIQQARQIQKEQQRMVVNQLDHALSMTLVDYTSVDVLLGDFYTEYAAEHEIIERAATLKVEGETLLQGFFHTWVNANPLIPARESIQKITLEAAKELLRKHTRLTSGLNPDNLPKGFYTQRSKDGVLVLCYSPEFAYSITPNPLTLGLAIRTPVSETWKGDFRLFEVDKYLSSATSTLDHRDLNRILLFAKLQPVRASYDEDYDQFVKTYFPRSTGIFSSVSTDQLLRNIERNQTKVKANWLVFLQIWQHLGRDGIQQFLDTPEEDLVLPLDEAVTLLLANVSADLREWFYHRLADDKNLRALGQVYYRFGEDGVRYFLTKVRQVEQALGHEFFDEVRQLLSASDNFNCFMSVEWFTAIDTMIEKLRPQHAIGLKLAWQRIFIHHLQSVGWENTEVLWHGFEYFAAEIAELGLELEGNEFDGLNPENMLVFMDRILASLKAIPGLESQQLFLKNLARMDLSHGGVHYALQHERFKFFDSDLQLYDFHQGTPTYASDLSGLYRWREDAAPLNMRRALASQSRFSAEAFNTLKQALDNGSMASRHKLMWLLHTDYRMEALEETLASLEEVNDRYQTRIAQHLHRAVYELGQKSLVVSLDAVIQLQSLSHAMDELLQQHPKGTFLEAITILHHSKRFDQSRAVARLFEQNTQKPHAYPEGLFNQSLKLAVLFGVEQTQLQQLFVSTKTLPPVVQQELKLLYIQLLSIDYATSDLEQLTNSANWSNLIECIQAMRQDLAHTATHRIQLIETLNQRGIQFKYSKTGEFRALTTKEQDAPADLGYFIDHEERLWRFLKAHIAVPVQGEAQEALMPIIRFLKRLQLNRTYLNEIEPLISTLEKTEQGKYWSASYFYEMLRAFQPDNDQTAYPISLLKAALEEHTIAPKPIDGIEKSFPSSLIAPIQCILKNTVFNRGQQTVLCKTALKEFNWQGSISLVNEIMAVFSDDVFAESRDFALNILAASKTFHELELRFEKSRWLLQHPGNDHVVEHWPAMSALWLKALNEQQASEDLLVNIRSSIDDGSQRQALILHVLAFSTLRQGLKDTATHVSEFNRKARKLVDRLKSLSDIDLRLMADVYPAQPSPGADDLLRMIKSVKGEQKSLKEAMDDFLTHPFKEPRPDYGSLASTRDEDLLRMITDTKVSAQAARQSLDAASVSRLILVFAELKKLESGHEQISGVNKPVSSMTRQELVNAFNGLSEASKQQPGDDHLRAQIWAIIFEALGRTTRKYPHLAQQFSLIANDISVNVATRVLQFATGEGKSHLVAMRAARNVGLGKQVDVCTAKRTLAKRDLIDDYQSFFDYLDIHTAYIHPKSSREEYVNSQVRYSTAGDISLFLDEQSYAGEPIEIDPRKRVALFDEFDFIVFEEGRKTEYNYARPTGATPKQMTWFYQAINEFYLLNKDALVDGGRIDAETLKALGQALQLAAGENEERQSLVIRLLNEPLQLVQWLQSAHEAHELNWGVEFTVREVEIHMGDESESYPMREIMPLSADNQTMFGSTYSAGVHQLLAVRLNTEARLRDEPQNFHIHPESNIISSQVVSQRMKQLWGSWEGFSGTISAAQAEMLNREYGTEVLHVPTNQRDLRFWNKPKFYDSAEERIHDVVVQIQHCLEQNKSFLFSCKNDKQVDWLKERLASHFSDEQIDQQFIFFTNEEQRSPSDVLESKMQMEQWHGGKKQRGIGLAASGFGRGDNVGVEAVFLFDVNDLNDLLQKGGRTGRNGEEGEVFQFYIRKELQAEERRLLELLGTHYPEAYDSIGDALAEAIGENEDEQCFQRVMALREFVFSLQNIANQEYRRAIAQLSSWGMDILGGIKEPTQRYSLTTRFSRMLKTLEKEWIDLSSQNLNLNGKISAIHDTILQQTQQFERTYTETTQAHALRFELAKYDARPIKLVLAKNPKASSEDDRALAAIGGVISRLPDHAKLQDVPKLMRILEEHKSLQRFANLMARCTSQEEFLQTLQLTVRQIINPSDAFQAVEASANSEIAMAHFFDSVSEPIKLAAMRQLRGLVPELQTLAVQRLCQTSMLSKESRIAEISPVLDYLNRLTVEQQQRWGSDYLIQYDRLLSESSSTRLAMRFSIARPMNIKHFHTIGKIANTVDFEGCSYEEVLHHIDRAISGTTEHRVRMLTKWESWGSINHTPQERLPLLLAFCRIMEQFEEGQNWDVFAGLVKKTTEWWNKGGTGQYKENLEALWMLLGKPGGQISQVSDLLAWGLTLQGKSWFEVMRPILKELSNQQMLNHQEQIKSLWQAIDASRYSKSEKTARFTQKIVALAKVYRLLDEKAEALNRAEILEKLRSLDVERFIILMDAVINHEASFEKFPKLFAQLLDYLADPTFSLNQTFLLNEMITLVVSSFEQGRTLSAEALFERLLLSLKVIKDEEKIRFAMTIVASDKKYFKRYPQVLERVLNYLADEEITLDAAELLYQAMFKAISYHEQHSEVSIEALLSGVERFRTQTPAVLRNMVDLFEQTNLSYVLFDNGAFYLSQNVSPIYTSKVRSVLIDFYSALPLESVKSEALFDQSALSPSFSFASNESNAERERRIILMHLLQKEVFVSDEQLAESNPIHPIDTEQNERLLQAGFNKYLAHAQTVLDANPVKSCLGKIRDLNVNQQTKLMKLANEFEVIGESNIRLTETNAQVTVMGQEVKSLLSAYQGSWFKAAHRKVEANELQAEIDDIMNQPIAEGERRYELVLAAIQQAKIKAIEEDFKINQTRGWFKLNRSGKSRYLNTLNQMQDMVIRHMTSDLHAVERLPILQQLGLEELSMLSQKLFDGLQDSFDEKFNPLDPRSKWLSSRLTQAGLFIPRNRKKLEAIRTLFGTLDRATQLANIEGTEATRRLIAVLNGLREQLPAIPTHLTHLTNDILARGDALINKLQDQVALDMLKEDLMHRDDALVS
ncbi:preprotein translocase subunit SecA [Legionella yabuuchiae]|uniref:preprotein translocase subunit SecA n=1 Tax=Legionella yabuuchiae TaxID=376727 RepID=UPI001056339F|nr:preprotein translocase subunit SecA [Legionella yabuuchiae]